MKDEDLYKKYPHIIPGSIEKVNYNSIIINGKNNQIKSHGKIAIIKCSSPDNFKGCLKTRIINIQDAKQTKYCFVCTRKHKNTRRRIRRRQKKY